MSGGFLGIADSREDPRRAAGLLAGSLQPPPETDDGRSLSGDRYAFVVWGDAGCIRSLGYVVAWRGNAAFRRALGRHDEKWERLLARLPEQGPGIFRDLPGQFAMGIVREESGEGILVVDRIGGAVPLAYATSGASLVFGTWAPAVARHPLVDAPLSEDALRCYLYFHVVPTPLTAFRGVERVEGGTAVSWKRDGLHRQDYWKPVYRPVGRRSFADLRAEFMDLLHRGVEECLEDGPVGCFLSGGTDSSTVLGILTRLRGAPQDTFSVGFEDERYDESHYARCAARHFGARLNSIRLTPSDLASILETIPRKFDGPFGNASAAPVLACAREARTRGFGHLLAGDGGDELFGGNKRYARQQVLELYHRIPGLIRHKVIEPVLLGHGDSRARALLRKPSAYVGRARRPLPIRLDEYNQFAELGGDDALTKAFRERLLGPSPQDLLGRAYLRPEAGHYLHRILGLDLKMTLEDNDLPKVETMGAAAEVVTDFPFLHPEIVDFALGLPPSWLVRRGRLRWFFKKALQDFLPEEILRKKKHGFGLPFGLWLLRDQHLNSLTQQAMNDLASRGILNPAMVQDLLRRHREEHPAHYGAFVWVLLQLELWLRAHAPDYRVPGSGN